jgi:hypothetical protein
MRRWALSFWSGLFGVAFIADAATALALDPPGDTQTLPCRPTIACTADLVAPGAFEIEVGALVRRIDSNARQWTFPVPTKLTVARWAQVQVGTNGYSLARGHVPAQYLDDVTPGMKFHLVDQSDVVPSLSLSALASIPTFRGPGYLRTFDALFTAYVTKDLGWLHADLNFGANAWRLDGNPRPQQWIALALSASLAPPFGIMAEGYYFTDAAPVAMRDGGFLVAINHGPRPWLMFDLGADVGMFPSTRAYSLFAGMSIVPVNLWRSPGSSRHAVGASVAQESDEE